MKLLLLLVLTTAALAPAQTPNPKKQAPAAAPAATTATAAQGHASLAALTRDLEEQKLAALAAYIDAKAGAKDAAQALVTATELASKLGRHDQRVRFAAKYLAQFPQGKEATAMQLEHAGGLRDQGDHAGARTIYEALIDGAGDDFNRLAMAAMAFGEMLVEQGKKDEAIELANVVGSSRSQVNGFKEHFDRIVASYELIGTDPKPLGNDLDGKPIDLAAYKGKVVLIDFWATWCGPCMQELPHVVAAYEQFHDRGFEIIGISLDRDRAAFDACIAENGMTWRHYYDGKFWENEVARDWGVRAIPATYLVGKDGKIAAVNLSGAQLEQRLARMLAPARK